MRLSSEEKRVLREMAAGWRPFPFQLSGLESSLKRKGLVRSVYDDQHREVFLLSPEGESVAEQVEADAAHPTNSAVTPTTEGARDE